MDGQWGEEAQCSDFFGDCRIQGLHYCWSEIFIKDVSEYLQFLTNSQSLLSYFCPVYWLARLLSPSDSISPLEITGGFFREKYAIFLAYCTYNCIFSALGFSTLPLGKRWASVFQDRSLVGNYCLFPNRSGSLYHFWWSSYCVYCLGTSTFSQKCCLPEYWIPWVLSTDPKVSSSRWPFLIFTPPLQTSQTSSPPFTPLIWALSSSRVSR